MARVSGEIWIDSPVEVVFDFVADQRNELQYNPRMVRSELVTAGPIGVGSEFHASLKGFGGTIELTIVYTEHQRAERLSSVTTMKSGVTVGTLTFEGVSGGTRLCWSWEVRPRGVLALLAPLVGWFGRRQERVIWAASSDSWRGR